MERRGRPMALRHHTATLALVTLAVVTVTAAAAGSHRSMTSRSASSQVVTDVGDIALPGRYRVRVTVSTTALGDTIELRVGRSFRRAIGVGRRRARTVAVDLELSGGNLIVTAVGRHARPRLLVHLSRLPSAERRGGAPTISPLTLNSAGGSSPSGPTLTPLPPPVSGPAAGAGPPVGAPPTGTSGPSGASPSNPGSGDVAPAVGSTAGGATGATGTTGATSTGTSYSRLVWSDEFNGMPGSLPLASNWSTDVGAWGSADGTLQTYRGSSANVSMNGQGNLAITALRQTATGSDGLTWNYTSGRIETAGLFSFTYGRVEARMKIPAGPGLWPAFWLVGDDISSVGWPSSGEIDVMEMLGQDPERVYGTVHGPVSGSSSGYAVQGDVVSPTSLADAFHTYGVIWQPGRITWTLDGTPYASVTPGDLARGQRWVFDGQPFHLILDLAVGGNWPGAPNATTPFPSTLLVDWVRVYQ